MPPRGRPSTHETEVAGHDFAAKIKMGMITSRNIETAMRIGDQTHHHDQSIYPVSFKTIKAIVRRPVNPMPPLEDELELSLTIAPGDI